MIDPILFNIDYNITTRPRDLKLIKLRRVVLILILTKITKVKWNARNKKRLIGLGYVFTKMGEYLEIDIQHASPYSREAIRIKCDYCGKEYISTLESNAKMMNSSSLVKKHCCNQDECRDSKIREVNNLKYGVDYFIALNSTREAIRKTNLQKYGVENPFESKDIQRKIENTNIKKYGFKSYTQTEEYKIKAEATSLTRYGKTHYAKTDEYSRLYSGENSAAWKGGIKHHRNERATMSYINWRRDVYNRDMYTCAKCNIKGGKLNAHHIANWKDNPNLRYDVSNGITLCEPCHVALHIKYGKKNNDKSQLDSFLN